jgi:hypothetical protein
MDHILQWMKQTGIALTVDAHCEANYGMSWNKLQAEEYPEWVADVLALVENGQLFVPTKGSNARQ